MKIKRFVAPDMRQALRQVREALGDDAVILSNKSIDDGVEITAAIDLVADESGVANGAKVQGRSSSVSTNDRGDERGNDLGKAAAGRGGATASLSAGGALDPLDEMRDEMLRLRRWLQAELSSMSWHDLGQRGPHAQELLQRLHRLGLSEDLVRNLAQRVDEAPTFDRAWRKALFYLGTELPVVEDDVLERGGVVALVGPTGVGKTTTIAKMAARYALRHGHRHVGLISTDSFRIGARDQLQTYGRILNVPVRVVNDPEGMQAALESLSDRRLILIDTAGMGANNERFDEQVEMLQAVGPPLRTLLTLSATTESAALDRAQRLFSITQPEACLLTKLDEAASLGPALSAVIHAQLPLAFLADGQRVPEDLHVARANPLVTRAAELLQQHEGDADSAYSALAYQGKDANVRL